MQNSNELNQKINLIKKLKATILTLLALFIFSIATIHGFNEQLKVNQ